MVQYNKVRQTSVAGTTDITFINSSKSSAMQVFYGEVVLTTENSSIIMRRPLIEILDESSNSFAKVSPGINQGAGVARNWLFSQGVARDTALIGTSFVTGMPIDFLIPPGWRFKVSVENALATDTYDAKFLFGKKNNF